MANDKKIEENKDMGWRERILMEMRKMCVTMQEPRLTASAVICISPRLCPWSVAQYWKCGKYFNSSSSQIHWFNSGFSTNEKISMMDCDDSIIATGKGNDYFTPIIYCTVCTFCYRYFHFMFNNLFICKWIALKSDEVWGSLLNACPLRFKWWIMTYRWMISTDHIVYCISQSPSHYTPWLWIVLYCWGGHITALWDNRRINGELVGCWYEVQRDRGLDPSPMGRLNDRH